MVTGLAVLKELRRNSLEVEAAHFSVLRAHELTVLCFFCYL